MIAPNLAPDAIFRFNFLMKKTCDELRRRTFQNVKECFNLNINFSMILCRTTKRELAWYQSRNFS
jgi:hypothetical protein